MNDETLDWIRYARENHQAAKLMLDHGLMNLCLQNCQQATEKFLKALVVESGMPLHRTHSIRQLVAWLSKSHLAVDLSEEDCDLLDSIYLPSKYPLGSAIPRFDPDTAICRRCLALVERTEMRVRDVLGLPLDNTGRDKD